MGKPHYSNDKDLRRHVAGLVKQGWTFMKGKTHYGYARASAIEAGW